MRFILFFLCFILAIGCALGDMPATPTDLEVIEPERRVELSFDKEWYYAGEEVTITATLINFLPTDIYYIEWYYCINDEEYKQDIWHLIEDAHELEYKYIITLDNSTYWWKIIVHRGEGPK